MAMASANNRNPGLDMLRACCALGVFFFHVGLLAPGWMGVPVFFVISGYVITQSVENHASGAPGERILAFYGRRVRRILPPLYIYLLVLLPIVVLAARDQLTGWLAAFTFTYNIYSISGRLQPSHMLSHLWSLGIEEQFYLVFPFLLIFARRHATRVLVAICIAMPLVRLGFSEIAARLPGIYRPAELAGLPVHQGAFATYFAGFTQIDAFAIGALLRLHHQRLMKYGTLDMILTATLVMVCLAFMATESAEGAYYYILLSTPDAYQHVWGYSLIAVMSALLIAFFSRLQPRTPLRRALVIFGGFSYEFYLVHRPIVRFYLDLFPIDGWFDQLAAVVVCGAAAMVLAMLLHYMAGQALARMARPARHSVEAAD